MWGEQGGVTVGSWWGHGTCSGLLEAEHLELRRPQAAFSIRHGRVELEDLDALVQAGGRDAGLASLRLGLPVGDLSGELHLQLLAVLLWRATGRQSEGWGLPTPRDRQPRGLQTAAARGAGRLGHSQTASQILSSKSDIQGPLDLKAITQS